jgi:hypothetical protein
MKELGHVILSLTAVLCIFGCVNADEEESSRDKKVLPVFQVVKFPNDACSVTGGSKNGTCYTTEECSNKGGVNAGSCASGFGVCCTFTLTCGGSSTENCTYFDSSTSQGTGSCKAEICKLNSDICQIRLDFSTFVITGPSTATASVGKMLSGQANLAGGAVVGDVTQCLTDTFSITNQNTVPVICGTNSGFHVYFDASDNCNSLDFQLGNVAKGVSASATYSWSIKINQYSCDYENLAPSGCTQYHFGSSGTNYVQTFNYQSGSGKHLADQTQVICVRRETGNCQVCWSADAVSDVEVSGIQSTPKGVVLGTKCCNYGADGKKIVTASGGYDCILVPGATLAGAIKPNKMCGNNMGIITQAGETSATLCSKALPFRIIFKSDAYEGWVDGSADEVGGAGVGFKVRYFQQTC